MVDLYGMPVCDVCKANGGRKSYLCNVTADSGWCNACQREIHSTRSTRADYWGPSGHG